MLIVFTTLLLYIGFGLVLPVPVPGTCINTNPYRTWYQYLI